VTLPSNSTNLRACKPLIHSYSTIYRSGEKTGVQGRVPLGFISVEYASKQTGGLGGATLEIPLTILLLILQP
jgi:hypothetical protein